MQPFSQHTGLVAPLDRVNEGVICHSEPLRAVAARNLLFELSLAGEPQVGTWTDKNVCPTNWKVMQPFSQHTGLVAPLDRVNVGRICHSEPLPALLAPSEVEGAARNLLLKFSTAASTAGLNLDGQECLSY